MTRCARILTALAAVTAVTAAGLVAGQGYETSQVRMHSGAVWLASARTGQATLVDGTTAEVRAQVAVSSPGSPLTISQQGNIAHVLNRATGELRRIDGATEQASTPVNVLPAGEEITMLAAPRELYGVDIVTGSVTLIDPLTSAARGKPARLANRIRPDGMIVDNRDRLWAVDHETGDLVWLSDGQRRTRAAASRSGAARLVLTRNQPTLVDAQRGTAELLDPETGDVVQSVRLDISNDDAVAASGSSDRPKLLITAGGALTVCDFDAGSCSEPVPIGSPGGELGAPVEIRDHAVVPDYSTGQATIIDLTSSRVVAERRLFDRPTRFELFAHDGIVFFNDPQSSRAGVLDLAGAVQTIAKYAEDPFATEGTPAEFPAQGDEVTKIGSRKQEPGLSVPSAAERTIRTKPEPPVGTASIVVKPGNHGVVGDDFELTMVHPPSAAATTTHWNLGDNDNTAVGTTVRHRWQRPGTFVVRAETLLDSSGVRLASAETTVTVELADAPPAITQLHVQRPKPVVGETVHFRADSTGNPTRWGWSITGPGTPTPTPIAQTAEFQHAFITPGTYTVALIISAGDKTAQSSQQFTVSLGAVKTWGMPGIVVPPAAQSGVTAIAAGSMHTLALKHDGSVIAWGENWRGELDVPASASSGVVAIAAMDSNSLALKADGSVIAWGNWPVRDVPAEAKSGVIAIDVGSLHALALKNDGSVIAWGDGNYGQETVPDAAKRDVTAIAAGQSHSMALKKDGSVIAWGDRDSGGCDVPSDAGTDAIALSGGQSYGLALKKGGAVIGWGLDYTEMLSVPPAAKSNVVAIEGGVLHALALKTNGAVVAWGDNSWGQTTVPAEYNSGVVDIAAGENFSVVLVDGLN